METSGRNWGHDVYLQMFGMYVCMDIVIQPVCPRTRHFRAARLSVVTPLGNAAHARLTASQQLAPDQTDPSHDNR